MSLIENVVSEPAEPLDLNGFEIQSSVSGAVTTTATPDAAVCPDCLKELFDPSDRRYRYPFINCTNCGPRYSLIKGLPYDRPQTTMSGFKLCPDCSDEYRSPLDRRYHAQPNACAVCGPRLSFATASGEVVVTDPVSATAETIRQGGIVAVKGIGGFHLLCDARNPEAVRLLRQRKQRPAKPFALLGTNPESLSGIVRLSPKRIDRLQAQDRPVVLCPFATEKDHIEVQPGVAPGLAWCGVMLPHTPIHYLLLHKLCGEPGGSNWLDQPQYPLLVMTSANRSGNPLVTDNNRALQELAGIADGFLLHDRDIHIRCDDSVVNGLSDTMPLIRRGRGLTPQVIRLPQAGPDTLAVGGFFKNTICVSKADKAYLSQYIGDLDNPDCCHALNEMVDHLTGLLDIDPVQVICDLHPDFYSSRFAREYAQRKAIPVIEVQHHHAHIAAVVAEQRLAGPVLGLALDGLGLGSDNRLWGGELLRVEEGEFIRLAHLPELKLPGGDRAAAEPWRVAAGILQDQGQKEKIADYFSFSATETVKQMLERNINCPTTTSTGRLFDGVAALLGLCSHNSYEAEAAMQLESSAYRYIQQQGWPDEAVLWSTDEQGQLSFDRLLARLTECDDQGFAAALFHKQLIDALCSWISRFRDAEQITDIVLGGGCFLNQILLQGVTEQLQSAGMQVWSSQRLPCNDGGLSLGQLQIGVARVARRDKQISEQSEQSEDKDSSGCV